MTNPRINGREIRLWRDSAIPPPTISDSELKVRTSWQHQVAEQSTCRNDHFIFSRGAKRQQFRMFLAYSVEVSNYASDVTWAKTAVDGQLCVYFKLAAVLPARGTCHVECSANKSWQHRSVMDRHGVTVLIKPFSAISIWCTRISSVGLIPGVIHSNDIWFSVIMKCTHVRLFFTVVLKVNTWIR